MPINIKMMKGKDLAYFLIVFICISLIIGLLFYMKSETAQCVKNPFVYGAERMGNVDCSCSQYSNPSCPAQFSFNETEVVAKTTICQGVGGLTNYPRGISFDIKE